jgi:hypothetical protein
MSGCGFVVIGITGSWEIDLGGGKKTVVITSLLVVNFVIYLVRFHH